MSESIECNCGALVGRFNEFMVFKQGSNVFHFAIKPGNYILDMKINGIIYIKFEKKKNRIFCNKCNMWMGVELPFGPNSSIFAAIGVDKIVIGKIKYSKVSELVGMFEGRNMHTFWGNAVAAIGNDSGAPDLLIGKKISITTCTAEKVEHFDWEPLLKSNKNPKPAQLESFYLSLLKNLIIVIPTGFGKTMIASLVIKRMKLLNPTKLAVMVVERVPLCYQQQKAIEEDTHLRVCALCGESSTRRLKSQVISGYYDVLVITAGCLNEMLNSYCKTFSVADFSIIVFDECHHIVGEHKYTKILEKVEQLEESYRPRLIGLSASPCSIKNFDDAVKSLRKLKEKLFGADIFHPMLPKSHQEIEWLTAPVSPAQVSFDNYLLIVIEENIKTVNKQVDRECIIHPKYFERQDWTAIRGLIRTFLPTEYSRLKKECNLIVDLMSLIEINSVIGTEAAATVLAKVYPAHTFTDNVQGEKSPRIVCLVNLLRKTEAESRILVFVETRDVATLLCDYLKKEFPEKNCSRVVGHSGFDGMDWKQEGGQHQIITDFIAGRCHLIVSTSVLEEGIDIQQCDLVIRYGGASLSLIKLVQTRGRARAKNGKLAVILTENEYHKVNELERQEVLIHDAISAVSNEVAITTISESKRELIARVEELTRQVYDAAVSQNSTSDITHQPGSCKKNYQFGFQVIVQGSLMKKSRESTITNIQQTVVRSLEQCGRVTRVEVIPRGANTSSALPHLFEDNDSVILVSVESQQYSSDFWQKLASVWDFNIDNYMSWITMSSLYSTYVETSSSFSCTSKMIEINDIVSVTVGTLENRQRYIQSTILCDSRGNSDNNNVMTCFYNTLIVQRERSLTLKGISGMYEFAIDISIHGIGSFILVGADRNKEIVALYIPLTNTPIVKFREVQIEDMDDDDNDNGTKSKFQRVVLPHTMPTIDSQSGGGGNSIQDELIRHLTSLSQNPVLSVTFTLAKWSEISQYFSDITFIPIPTFLTSIATLHSTLPQTLPTTTSLTTMLQRKCMWILRVLAAEVYCIPLTMNVLLHIYKSVHDAIVYNQNPSSDRTMPPLPVMITVLEQLLYLLKTGSPWMNALETFYKLLEGKINESTSYKVQHDEIQNILPQNYYQIDRVYITPSRIVCLPSVPVKGSRLLRNFPNHQFIFVSFKDEFFVPIYNEYFQCRVQQFFEYGFDIGDQHFEFVACSGSQIRSQTFTFVSGDNDTVRNIRKTLIPNVEEKYENKYSKFVSRLGLFCTADCPTLDIEECQVISDSKALDGHLLTDGAGYIDQDLLDECLAEDMKGQVSAIQIRLQGLKGVLLGIPNLKKNMTCSVQYRDSMYKCDSPINNMGIVKESKYTPLRLNRDALTLLFTLGTRIGEDCNWNLARNVSLLQDQELERLSKLLLDNDAAILALKSYIDPQIVSLLKESGICLLNEPFWLSLLQLTYHHGIRSLVTKTHIPVHQGCMLMGVPDPYQVLDDDEVFFCISDSSLSDRVVVGPVLVYRNPCLLPGDIRILQAVNKPELKGFRNVIIFPSIDGKTKASVAADCSGGDLDGDMFSIIWDPDLVPDKRFERQATDYDRINKDGEERQLQNENPPISLPQFLVSTAFNPTLGRIANAHLALCDSIEGGALHPLAVEVAKQQSVAVDSPKTGILAMMPTDIEKELTSYPDFMEKPNKVTHISNKPLGIMYRKCKSLVVDVELATVETSFCPSPLFAWKGEEEFITDAKTIYELYALAARSIIIRFELQSESELILGIPYRWTSELTSDQGTAKDALTEAWNAVKKKFRSIFFSGLLPNDERRFSKMSAWYHAAYSTDRPKSESFLSFPWVVCDVLLDLRHRNVSLSLPMEVEMDGGDVYSVIGRNYLELWKNDLPELLQALAEKTRRFNEVRIALESFSGCDCFKVTGVELFGSVALLLCDHFSDLDICVFPSPQAVEIMQKMELLESEKEFLKQAVSPAVNSIAISKRLIGSVDVPLIRLDERDLDGSMSIDISVRQDGVHKATLIRRIYAGIPSALVIFSAILSWSRCCGVVRSHKAEESGTALLKTGELQALLISLLYSKFIATLPPAESIGTVDKYEKFLSSAQSCDLEVVGKSLMNFFFLASKLHGEFIYDWPVAGAPRHQITSATIELFALRCDRAYHCLVVSRSWRFLLAQSAAEEIAETKFVQRLSTGMSDALRDAVEFHAGRLQILSGAKVSIVEDAGRLELAGVGTKAQIQSLRHEIIALVNSSRSTYFGVIQQNLGAYFMEGSILILARRATNQDDSLKMLSYPGCPIHSRHRLQSITVPVLQSKPTSDEIWKYNFKSILKEKILTQIGPMTIEESESLRFSIHFGTFYAINAANCLDHRLSCLSMKELETALVRGKRHWQDFHRDGTDETEDDYNMRKSTYANDTNKVYEMEVIKPPSGDSLQSSVDGENVRETVSKVRRGPQSMSSSYYPRIAKMHPPPRDTTQLFDKLGKILISCQFEKLHDGNKNHPFYNVSNEVYIIEVCNNALLTTEVRLDKEMNVTKVSEPSVKWVHATLLHGNNEVDNDTNIIPSDILGNHDLRVKVATKRFFSPGDTNYEFSCPGGLSPISLNAKKEIQIAEHLPADVAEGVSFVRKVNERIVYRSNDNMPVMAVVLQRGCHAVGSKLGTIIDFSDLSIEVDVSILRNWIADHSKLEEIAKWIDDVLDIVLVISDAIRKADKIS